MPGGDDSEGSNIPSINLTTSTELLRVPTDHDEGASSVRLVVPNSPSNADGPLFPTDISETGSIPPVPTRVFFASSLQLRDNRPEERSGLSSLDLLNPRGLSTHDRRGSGTISITDLRVHSATNSVTNVSDVDYHLSSVNDGPSGEADNVKEEDEPNKTREKGAGVEKEYNEPTMTTHQLQLSGDEAIDPTPFSVKPYQLMHMLDPKNMDTLISFGGIEGLLHSLGTNSEHGLSSKDASREKGKQGAGLGASHKHESEETNQWRSRDMDEKVANIVSTGPSGKVMAPTKNDDGAAYHATLEDRRRVFGENVLPTRSKTLLQFMWLAMKDKVLILLSIAAIVSLALGFFLDFGTQRPSGDPPVDWVKGVAIIIAIAIVVFVGSINDWQREQQFKALKQCKEERGVKVIRDGVQKVIDIKEVVVGDIALLEPGEIVPCDGIFISGHNVKCDESSATGETDALKKFSYDKAVKLHRKAVASGLDPDAGKTDCFVISGSKILEGVGRYVVVAVGTKSFDGRIKMALCGDTESSPLQLKLNDLAELIAKIGSAAGLALFTALLIKFFVQLGKGNPPRNANDNGIAFVNILIIAVTLIVIAVPEGLPLAVTLTLAFATKRMTYENLLVRALSSCEVMANASVICTDKTGTLTQNTMTVVAGSVGIHAKFVRLLDQNAARSNPETSVTEIKKKRYRDFSIDQSQLNNVVSPALQSLFNEAIAVNSTAFEDIDPEDPTKTVFVGSKTETALLQFARELGWRAFQETRDNADIVQMIPFSSERKYMGVVVRLPDGRYRTYFKGASEILVKKTTRYVVVSQDGQQADSDDIETVIIDDLARENITRTIIFYANQTLRTIALCYRDLESWHPSSIRPDKNDDVPFEDLAKDLTLIGIAGIEDPLRNGVRDAVMKCHRAGVTVKMCTGDNVLTARSIATQCGIFTMGGIIMEGPVFRTLSQTEMIQFVPRLQVLARSSPEDKNMLVKTLKMIGEVVAVTGDNTNDGSALKNANVGFSMGIAGTQMSKEAADIVLMDDSFMSIVKAIMWGRCINDAVRKVLQFQISTNITAVVITFVSAVASTEETSVLSAVQLLWISIIMDTFAALALASDPATESLLDRKPGRKSAPLFSVEMYKMILVQSIYQITVILVFHFRGVEILGMAHTTHNEAVVNTVIFNAFVFAQIFNSMNCRRLDSHLNIFKGILKNHFFIAITLIEIVVQALIVFVGGAAFQVTRIGGREWGVSLALGVVSIPLGVVVRCLSSKPFEKFFKFTRLMSSPEVLPTVAPDLERWGTSDNLSIFTNIRGGRLRSSSFVVRSRSTRPSQYDYQISSLLTMAPTLITGAVAGGRPYLYQGSLSDPADADPSKSSAALWEGKLQIHPDTSPDDPIYRQFAGIGNMA